MVKFSDKVLTYMASTAEDAFWEALGLASRTGMYEPEMSDAARAYKAEHTSKLEELFNKFVK